MINFFDNYFKNISDSTNSVDQEDLRKIALSIEEMKFLGGKLIIVGNGGSAAISSHVAVDFTKAANIRAINFNEADLITCFANDYGYENWVVEALKAYSDPNDVVILISSSGSSKNIVNAAKFCKTNSIKAFTFSGFKSNNDLRQLGLINLWVNSELYNIVEMTHHIWILAILDYIIINKKNQN